MEKKISDAARGKRKKEPSQSEMVLVFARAPVAGRVKTRLASELDAGRIAELYKCFVEDVLYKLRQERLPVRLCYHPPESGKMMRQWLGRGIEYQSQQGSDLGEKMSAAFASAFSSGADRSILIGTDIPDLPGTFFTEGLSALANHDAVIGPAVDGGYYLIGFRNNAFRPSIFENIPWGTASVCNLTLTRLHACSASVYQLPQWLDIDSYMDLKALSSSLAGGDTFAPTTAAYLAKNGDVLFRQEP
jgi:hypothetical protein